MKTAIIYSSKTGNTKKVALRIQTALTDSDIFEINGIENPKKYELIILGCWIDRGTADAKALKVFKTLKNENVAFFFTLGAYPDSKHATDCNETLTQLLKENGNTIHGSFWCHGKIDTALTKWYETLPLDHPHGLNPDRVKRLKIAETHPDENDFVNAGNYFKELISKMETKS